MKDIQGLNFEATKKLAKLNSEALKVLGLLKNTLYDEITNSTSEIQERGQKLSSEEEINTHRDAYIKVLTTTHNYKDVSSKVFVSERFTLPDGTTKNVTEDKLKLLVSYHLGKKYLETVLIPLSGNAIQTLSTNLTELAVDNIYKIVKGNNPFFPEETKDLFKKFSKNKFKKVITRDSNNISREELVQEKLDSNKSSLRTSSILSRLNTLKQEGWKVIENYLQEDLLTGLPSLILTMFKVKKDSGTVLTLTIDNDGHWSSEKEKLSLILKSWTKLLKLWYTKVSENEELMKKLQEQLLEKNKEI